MAGQSTIEWTNKTWNPTTGCTKVSPGCKNCYAERFAHRLLHMHSVRYQEGFKLALHNDVLELPLKGKRPSLIFVNSMSDLFHEAIPDDFIRKTFQIMNEAHWHSFQILTKRSARLKELANTLSWTTNIWIGVSVESYQYYFRINDLQAVPASVLFISAEPLLSDLPGLPLENIHWVIVGGESGPGSRPVLSAWVENVLAQCRHRNVPFFFKQWGGTFKKRNGRLLNGMEYNERPICRSHAAELLG